MGVEVGLVQALWSGTSGGVGVTTLAVKRTDAANLTATDAQNACDNVRAFLASSAAVIPGGITINVQPTVDVYDSESGVVSGAVVAASTPTAISGAASGNWANGTGYRVDWATGFVRRRKLIVGRTYIVPASSLAFATDGTLDNANKATLTGHATTLISAMAADTLDLCVWCRPTTTTSNDGVAAEVLGASIPDKSAVLRSRRD